MAEFSIAAVAQALGAQAQGDTALTITGAAEPQSASPQDLALAMDPRYAEGLRRGRARAALLWLDADWQALGLEAAVFAPRGRLALAGLTALLDPGLGLDPGVHPSAVSADDAQIGEGAAIGPFCTIGRGTRLGARAQIGPHVSIGANCTIGDDAVIHAGTRIGANVRIGDRVLIQPGAVIGADGFSYVTPEKSRAEAARETMGDAVDAQTQSWVRIHSLGGVVLGDDIEIGANSCIDAGTIRPTTIGNRTKLDNQVHIAHNCQIGEDCLFAGQVGVAGSARVGRGVILGGKTGVSDNIFVGDGVVAGGATVIMSNVPAGRVILGYPAVKMETHVAMYKALRRLPRMLRDGLARKNPVPNSSQND
ncbi:MAG: UDP-3-O-(3-hydroxymyristoyl)glucosamine N-acyltransferase [Pseudomonadota bacterium]